MNRSQAWAALLNGELLTIKQTFQSDLPLENSVFSKNPI